MGKVIHYMRVSCPQQGAWDNYARESRTWRGYKGSHKPTEPMVTDDVDEVTCRKCLKHMEKKSIRTFKCAYCMVEFDAAVSFMEDTIPVFCSTQCEKAANSFANGSDDRTGLGIWYDAECVYIMSPAKHSSIDQDGKMFCKIGMTKNLKDRFGDVNACSPVDLMVVHAYQPKYINYADLEREIHLAYSKERYRGKYEWFNLEVGQVKEVIELMKELDEKKKGKAA